MGSVSKNSTTNLVIGVTGMGTSPSCEITKEATISTAVAVLREGNQRITQIILKTASGQTAFLKYEDADLPTGKTATINWVAPNVKSIQKGDNFAITPQPDKREFTIDIHGDRGDGWHHQCTFSFVLD